MVETKNKKASDGAAPVSTKPGRGFWAETWLRFRRRKLAMAALVFVVFLALVALLSPAIVGTKPLVVKYKGKIYFPALGYFDPAWENPIFINEGFLDRYPKNLRRKDPDSWAIWPLVYQDPYRAVEENEFGDNDLIAETIDVGRPFLTTSGMAAQLAPATAAILTARAAADGWSAESVLAVGTGETQNPDRAPPSGDHFFGTDKERVDVFAQMVHGTRIALLVGFVSTGIAAFIGIWVGAVAGYFGGWADTALSRVIEVVMCIPALVLILALMAIVEKPSIWTVMIVLGVTGWTGIARLTRAEFLKLREMEFVRSARSLGVSHLSIIVRHILPNALAPVMVPITFGIAGAILLESGISFLGIGPTDTLSWGRILRSSSPNENLWWLIFFPGFAIFLTVLAYNLIGEGLQEATDPRLREAGK